MKKIIRILIYVIGFLFIVGLAGFLFINMRGIPSYKTSELNYQVELDSQKIARGEKLVSLLCYQCHFNSKSGKLTGKLMTEAPPEFGKIYAPNITQDKEYGIGNYTDGEILYLLRTGIKKNGQYAPPYMAKLPHMADSDIASVIAFLRSDNPWVQASKTEDYPCEPSFLTKFLSNVAFKPLKMPEKRVEMPDTTDMVVFGKYLTINLECFSCHSADFKTLNIENPELSEGYMGGGNKPLNKKGEVMLTQNLTPDKETGIGNWSEDQFVNAVRFGRKDGEPALRFPMVPFPQITDYEAKSIFAYLKTIPPINNKVPRSGL